MFIETKRSGYDRYGQQFASGYFLILTSDKGKPLGPDNFRANVVYTRLSQCGHWMMGTIRVAGEVLSVSGSYGGDGLTMHVSSKVHEAGIPVPKELYDAWSKGGGWNSAGTEAPLMREFGKRIYEYKYLAHGKRYSVLQFQPHSNLHKRIYNTDIYQRATLTASNKAAINRYCEVWDNIEGKVIFTYNVTIDTPDIHEVAVKMKLGRE